MNWIRKLYCFLKTIFNKESTVKLIGAPIEPIKKLDKNNFKNSLRVNTLFSNQKKKVETLTCLGDGLGIQTKISF